MDFDSCTIDIIRSILTDRHQTIAVAESVTAGLLQGGLASAEKASDFFEGGITVYNIDQKVKHLHIDREIGEACNCVSAEIASQMAEGVLKMFGSHWGVAVTGYATPVEESDNRVYAYFAIAEKGKTIHTGKIDMDDKKGTEAQLEYVNRILQSFAALVNG